MKADSKWCNACHFTGAQTLDLFPQPPPPLLPVLDAACIFSDRDVWRIDQARGRLHRRFPQFQWRVCTVDLLPGTDLSVFGFWLLNVCPLYRHEKAEDRAGTLLLLINSGTGEVAAVPGYAVEHVLSDDQWRTILVTMKDPWRAGRPVEAVIQFFKSTRRELESAWERYGVRFIGK